MRSIVCTAALAALTATPRVQAQTVVLSRRDAVEAALARGARSAAAQADTAAAAAQVALARQWPNPSLSLSYSKSTPQYHYALEQPLDLPYLRQPRVASARAAQRAMQARFANERAAIGMEADTAYTRAVAARDLAMLSARNAADADSLRRLALIRREAGDASEMDVALAALAAGAAANDAASDSLAAASALIDLQSVIGFATTDGLVLRDTLGPPPPPAGTSNGDPLLVYAATQQLEAASLAVTVERRGWLGAPSLVAGWEHGDPTGAEPGRLPTLGLALPVPLFNRNQAARDAAQAEAARAKAALMATNISVRTERDRAAREYAAARSRLMRDEQLAIAAARVAAMALVAYREGAAPMVSVLEARRTAREVMARRIRDAADAWVAAAELQVLTLTVSSRAP